MLMLHRMIGGKKNVNFYRCRCCISDTIQEDLSVDYDQLEKFIDFQIDNGTDSIVICGTSGEASTMSHDEQIEVVSACVSHVNGRVPVIAGAGANCTDEA